MIADLLAAPQPDGDPSKNMVDIFHRPEFDRSPGWWSRAGSAIGRFFHALSFSWLGPVGQFVLWLLLIVGTLALVAWLWRSWQNSGRRWPWHRTPKASGDIVPIDINSLTDPEELRTERTAFEDQRDYKQAILFRYRELVATLMMGRLVSNQPGRTTGELRADIAASSPAARRSFGLATDIFEVAWYSDELSTPESFQRLDQLVSTTLAETGSGVSA